MDLDFDSPFVFAEVNADRVTWTYNTTTGETKRLYSETKSIGQFTSTKAVGSYARQDVTSSYKYPEGNAFPGGEKGVEAVSQACGEVLGRPLAAGRGHGEWGGEPRP